MPGIQRSQQLERSFKDGEMDQGASDAERVRVINKWRPHELKVVKIQKLYRGYVTRKHIKEQNEIADPVPKISHRSSRKRLLNNNLSNIYKRAKELDVMPDYSNQFTRETEQRLGTFIFDADPAS